MHATSAKTKNFIRFVLFLGMLLALAIFVQPIKAATNNYVVKPSSSDWAFVNDNGTSGDWATGFETGPATPPLGSGSFYIQLNSAAAGIFLGSQKYQGTYLSNISALSYSTYTNQQPQAISFQINYDPDLTTVEGTWYGRLIYEPYVNGTVSNNTWQTWDMINGGNGKWWASNNGNSTVDNTCPQGSPCTWNALIAAYPNIGIRNDANSMILFKAGSNWNGFDGNADNFTFETSGGDTDIYDFEPETPCTTTCYVNTATGNDSFGGDTPTSAKKTIQAAVNQVSANGTVSVAAGTYNENVSINTNGITLIGAVALNPNDSVNPVTQTIIDGSAPPASGSSPGINISNGITNVTIKNLRVQQFGSSSGIHGGPGNNGLRIENVHVYNNNASGGYGAGIWIDGPVDGVTINNVDAQYNKSRGIVVWNGFKQHITITNSYAAHNNCCGIELQDGTASGVTISGNTSINNTDSGMAATGLTSGAGANVISNNTVTDNGRFGIEIKLPSGTGLDSGDGSIVVENNTVSLTATPADLRDYAGIAVFRRGWQSGNADIPTGVIVRNNSVSGYVQSNGGSFSTGFGIVAEGNNMQVSNNALTGNDVGVQVQAGHLPYVANTNTDGDQTNLSDNYFGRGNSPVACVRVDGNTYSSNGIDFRVVGSNAHGSPTVHNETQDTYHCGIQVAIDAATSGDTLRASAGTYVEDLDIDKPLTLLGPNDSINPNTGSRVPEAVIQPSTSNPNPAVCTNMAYLETSNITIKGFTFDGDNPSLTSGITINGADVDACEILSGYEGMGNITVENNILKRATNAGIDFYNYTNNAATSNNYIRYNLFSDIGETTYNSGVGVIVYNNFYADVTENVFNNVRTGIQTGNFYRANVGSTGSITNNTINAWRLGIFHNLWYSNASTISVADNTINAISSASSTKWNGMLISSWQNAANTTITDNIINIGTITQNPAAGYNIWNTPTSAHLTISGGSVTGGNYGIWVNNFEGYASNAGNTSIYVDDVDISDASTAGLYVLDSPSNTNGATVFASVQNSTITNTPTGILVEGADGNAALTTSNVTATASGNALDVKSGGSVTANNTLDLNGNTTIESGGTLTAGTTSEIRVAGNWSNSGTFTPGTGKVKFDGAVAQSIGGSVNPAPFNDLDLSNTHANGITSSVDATVAGQLAMNQDSNLDMGANTMTMGASSNPATAGTGQGDVVGQVKRTSFNSGTSYNFGSPFLAFNDLTFTTAPTEIDVTLATSTPGTYPTAIQRTYTLNVNGGAGVNTDLQLHYRDDASTLNGNTEASLGLHRYNGSSWDDLGYDSRNVSNNWVQRDSIGTFSDWTLANSTPTSATLTQFSGRKTPAGVELNWETGAELNLLGFNIWRARGKGEYVQVNAELVAVQNPGAVTGSSYLYLDPLSKKGRYRYKLEMLTTSGSDWSDPIKVRVKPAVKGCANVVEKAQNLVPKNKAVVKGKGVRFDWADVPCATRYELTLRKGSATGAPLASESNLQASDYTVPSLKAGVYFWSVRGCNATSCGPTKTVRFTLERNK